MKYLKYFLKDSEYRVYIDSENAIFPNVSYSVDLKKNYFKNNNLVPKLNKFSGTVISNEDNGLVALFATTGYDFEKNEPFAALKETDIKSVKVDNQIMDISFTKVGDDYEVLAYQLPKGKYTFEVELNTPIIDSSLFSGNPFLESLDLSNLDISKLSNVDYMFTECSSLTHLNLSGWDLNNINIVNDGMFNNCSLLTHLNLSNWHSDNVFVFNSYLGAMPLEELNLSGWNFKKFYSLNYMFKGCSYLRSIDLTNVNYFNEYAYDLEPVLQVGNTFENCSELTEVRLGGDLSFVKGYYKMFENVADNGKLYYNRTYNYDMLIEVLPSSWLAIPCDLINGVLIPVGEGINGGGKDRIGEYGSLVPPS